MVVACLVLFILLHLGLDLQFVQFVQYVCWKVGFLIRIFEMSHMEFDMTNLHPINAIASNNVDKSCSTYCRLVEDNIAFSSD